MTDRTPLSALEAAVPFAERHIGPRPDELARMLERLGYPSMDALVAAALPSGILDTAPLDLPAAATESEVLAELAELAGRNTVNRSMIGLGYSDTVTPPVIRRNILENPAWYTAYTPYQPEISQGRLEALLTFQTVVEDLTALPVAGASLLDEATAAAEAMALCRRSNKSTGPFVVDADTHPQTIAVLQTRARAVGAEIVVLDMTETWPEGVTDPCGLLLSYPGSSGAVRELAPLVAEAHRRGALVVVAADLLALTLLTPPGEVGADVAVGSAQRFGVPMWFGGPHAGYLAVRSGLERTMPGRLVGVSIDADGAPAYRLALQTREQHIRREKATSNICTAQVLLAVIAAAYAAYHGPDGLAGIARRVNRYATLLAAALGEAGVEVVHRAFFDTLTVRVPGRAAAVLAAARERGVNLRAVDADTVGISCDETTGRADVAAVLGAFGVPAPAPAELEALDLRTGGSWPERLGRRTPYLTHPVFAVHRSETAMLRYLRRLADRDVALDRSMIPLGSCTMKLNATVEMEPVSWPGFARMHPYAPAEQTTGYTELIGTLERWLAEITGYDAVSVQPNAGSQGEFAGLLAIRGYHEANGQGRRDVCLIPASAHGTNAASAAMAGMRVVVVKCDTDGNIDLPDLDALLTVHRDALAGIMLTYPSTHGVFEPTITEVCARVHDAGGQVYVDGANLNALVGLARPGRFGADVSHLNLHKTFCIPHGGGGPGVGPVAVRAHLAPYLPGRLRLPGAGRSDDVGGPGGGRSDGVGGGRSDGVGGVGSDGVGGLGSDRVGGVGSDRVGGVGSDRVGGVVGPVSAAPYGSAGILPISWAYIRLMGPDGLRRATEVAVLAANYVARRLAGHYPVLYTGAAGLVAHECIVDVRGITRETGVTVEDIAKRLIDYGFHAPTMSFPVAGTLMIEPTESEDLAELDRFCDAMIAIKAEIDRVGAGEWDREDNPLRQAPHTASMLAGEWAHGYDREVAAYPVPGLRAAKYWPPVRRIESAYGDRNLVCACPPVEAFAE